MFKKVQEWLLKLAAKKAAKKLKLEDGPMTDGKKWWKSKTVISGILVVLFGAYDLARANLAPTVGWTLPEIPGLVFTILGVLGVYGRVSADKIITK